MKITAINGSPKITGVSALIIKQIEKLIDEHIEIYHAIQLVRTETPTDTMDEILEADTLLIVFPLYMDSLPSPLIELLTRLENTVCYGATTPQVYTIVNGALDSQQTNLALDMVAHFASRVGLSWGYGIGIGAGSMLYNAGDNWENGLAFDIYCALRDMVRAIEGKRGGQNVFATPKIPQFLYKSIANTGFWLDAKRNGAGSLRAQPYRTSIGNIQKIRKGDKTW